ncbi:MULTISPECIES: type II toxin-antitoxin system Phd/YefM family antitoxin [unclassified Crossiella]|uniref:type II toxin-antitoxin system Phd/YefM family antitoxin n=1 Tax=unclassified Crossiella TaxID=2620835 RepID=UPI001FFFE326|nr:MULTISPECIES: hypothetical protein [unclassified Crossiella]MCK2241088.1 hypothetical protein [Crossiella sp. S99.2]MCK2253768.1 hypothetical protein [Crossiella sp. S99.1]
MGKRKEYGLLVSGPPAAVTIQVPVGTLLHDWPSVLGRITDGERVQVTRNGKVVAVLTAPDPNEVALDELAASGQVAADWRERQSTLRGLLRTLPARTAKPGDDRGSAAVLADREDSDR